MNEKEDETRNLDSQTMGESRGPGSLPRAVPWLQMQVPGLQADKRLLQRQDLCLCQTTKSALMCAGNFSAAEIWWHDDLANLGR